MRFTTTVASALSAAAMLAGSAYADADADADGQKVLGHDASQSSSSTSTSTSTSLQLPTFTPTTIKAEFLEQFTDGWKQRWKPSHAKKETDEQDEQWAYVGEWSVQEPTIFKGMKGDKGLVVKNAAAHHAISAQFPNQIDPKGKTLVVQYEVKLQNGLECGGAYLKLLRENKALHQEEFSNTTPYVIMFGPDKCGHTNKVHFIFNHKNPKTGEYEEKHLSAPSTAKIVRTTELYTLVVYPNNTFSIRQNGIETKSGSLLNDFKPPVNPPAEIDDPKDSKPDDWVDQARIPDPEATKPEDWDEDAPFEIVDEDATTPEDWLEDEPLTVPDPEAQKPEDWDDDEDGDWMAPEVPNPKCADVSGCGPWSRPTKKNPDYRGKWSAPLVDNPDYEGPWAPRKIANPDYFEDQTPANFEPIGAIGFEIWTMQKDILFDNIYIGHSVEDADRFAEETFKLKHAAEKAADEATKPMEDLKAKSPSDLSFFSDPVMYVREKIELFITIAKRDPIEAVKFVPEVAAGIVSIVIGLVVLVASVVAGGSSSPAVKQAATKGKKAVTDAKQSAVDAKDKVVAQTKEVKDKATDAAASGAEAVKAEATKRK